jgi:hypothetical protein
MPAARMSRSGRPNHERATAVIATRTTVTAEMPEEEVAPTTTADVPLSPRDACAQHPCKVRRGTFTVTYGPGDVAVGVPSPDLRAETQRAVSCLERRTLPTPMRDQGVPRRARGERSAPSPSPRGVDPRRGLRARWRSCHATPYTDPRRIICRQPAPGHAAAQVSIGNAGTSGESAVETSAYAGRNRRGGLRVRGPAGVGL